MPLGLCKQRVPRFLKSLLPHPAKSSTRPHRARILCTFWLCGCHTPRLVRTFARIVLLCPPTSVSNETARNPHAPAIFGRSQSSHTPRTAPRLRKTSTTTLNAFPLLLPPPSFSLFQQPPSPPSRRNEKPRLRSWKLEPNPTAIREGHTGRKTAVETTGSTIRRLRGIKIPC